LHAYANTHVRLAGSDVFLEGLDVALGLQSIHSMTKSSNTGKDEFLVKQREVSANNMRYGP
jgi:hypothetical protein